MAPAKKVFSNISSDDNNIIKKEANQQIMDSYNSKSPVLPWEISEEEKTTEFVKAKFNNNLNFS